MNPKPSHLTQLIHARDELDARILAEVAELARAVARARGWLEDVRPVRVSIASNDQDLVLDWEFSTDRGVFIEQEYVRPDEIMSPEAAFLRIRRAHRFVCRNCGCREMDTHCSTCDEVCEPCWFDPDDKPVDVHAIVRYLIDSDQAAEFVRDFGALSEAQVAGLTSSMLKPLLLANDRQVREAALAALGRTIANVGPTRPRR